MLDQLERSDRWSGAAAGLLSELGFRLVPPEAPDRAGGHLLVALRESPTLRHFDPELVGYYAPTAGRASFELIDRLEPGPTGSSTVRPALWGHVHLIDRVPVENRFLTFGGDLRMAAIDPGLTVVDLRSPAPIVRWGGHSQGTDELTLAMGAFFGRLIVPIDLTPGVEALVDSQSPDVLYRAFLADGLRRAAAAERRGLAPTGFDAWLAAAWMRAREDEAACDRASALLRELHLDGPPT